MTLTAMAGFVAHVGGRAPECMAGTTTPVSAVSEPAAQDVHRQGPRTRSAPHVGTCSDLAFGAGVGGHHEDASPERFWWTLVVAVA